MIQSIKRAVEILDNEMLEILKDFKLEFKALNDKIDRNGIMLEQLNKKVEILAKVQTSHKKQNERRFEKILQDQGNANTLLT